MKRDANFFSSRPAFRLGVNEVMSTDHPHPLCESNAHQCKEIHLGRSISDFFLYYRSKKLLMHILSTVLGSFSHFPRWLVSSLYFETLDAGPLSWPRLV